MRVHRRKDLVQFVLVFENRHGLHHVDVLKHQHHHAYGGAVVVRPQRQLRPPQWATIGTKWSRVVIPMWACPIHMNIFVLAGTGLAVSTCSLLACASTSGAVTGSSMNLPQMSMPPTISLRAVPIGTVESQRRATHPPESPAPSEWLAPDTVCTTERSASCTCCQQRHQQTARLQAATVHCQAPSGAH